MMPRHLTHRPAPSLTGGSDSERPPCAANPKPFDAVLDRRGNERHAAAREAVAICAACPLLDACLRAGIEGKETGVWGGQLLDGGKVTRIRPEHKSREEVAADRIALLRRIAEEGGVFTDAVAACGIGGGSLRHWLRKNGEHHLLDALAPPLPAPPPPKRPRSLRGIPEHIREAHATFVRLKDHGLEVPADIRDGERVYQALRHVNRKRRSAA